MNILQNHILCKSLLAPVLLFTIYGCQDTVKTITPVQPVSIQKSDSKQAYTENAELDQQQTVQVDRETVTAEQQADMDKERMEEFYKRFGSLLGGHGGVSKGIEKEPLTTEKSVEKTTAKTADMGERPFAGLEKKLYGKWMDINETESYEFSDDGTVMIIVTDERGRNQRLNGNYKLVKEDRIRISFTGDFLANLIPTRHFKIFISENEFTLTDEPDGATTGYKRVK